MAEVLKRLWLEEQAESLSEYALFLLLVSMTAVSTMGGLASTINTYYSRASTRVEAAGQSGFRAGGSLGYEGQACTDKDFLSRDQENLKAR